MGKYNNIHFLMIGRFSSEGIRILKNVNNKNFHIVGELSHKELSDYYSFIDIGFILYKGLDLNLEYCAPNKLYEYWSHGVYVIAHPLKGLAEVIKDNKMGILVNLENTIEIETAVQSFTSIAGGEIRQYIRMGFDSKYSISDSIGLLNERLDEFA
jgi:glycosyltransferase involved in cell wall biosynthesis